MCKSYILQRVRFPYLAKASNLSNLYNNPPTPAGCWGSAPEKNAPETEADRQAARPADRQKRDRETALCLELALAAGSCIFLDFSIGSESNVRHWQGVTQVTIRHALTGG